MPILLYGMLVVRSGQAVVAGMQGDDVRNWISSSSLKLLVFWALLLAGCSGPPDAIIGVSSGGLRAEDVAGTSRHEIFIATTRAPAAETTLLYSGERSDNIGLARVSVTIPPNHVSGEIERPTSLPPNPRTNFTVLDPQTFADGRSFVEKINEALAARPKKDRNILVFVHGYNTTLTAAILRLSQFVEDSGFTGVPVLFSWASRGKVFDYVYDLNSALHARDDLIETSKLLLRTKAKGFDIIAHSMGNLLTMEAMRQAKLEGNFNKSGRLQNVILASPDIDADVFKKQIAPFSSSERRFYILISADDKALSFSRRIAGGVSRVGAEAADELAGLGVTVIDLTEVDDSGSSHSKFAGSPEVVQLIGHRLRAGDRLYPVGQGGGLIGNVASGLNIIPAALGGLQGRVYIVAR